MKFLLFSLALIMMVQLSFTTNSPQWTEMSDFLIFKSELIQNLRDLGADYVMQQGVFASTTEPLPGKFYEVTSTLKAERKITNTTTFYRFNVILTEFDELAVVNATYVVSFDFGTGAFMVNSFRYNIIENNPDGENSIGGPSLIDVRPLNNGSDELTPLLSESIDYVIADAIDNGQLPEAKYMLKYVYTAYLMDYGYPATYVFFVKLVNNKGQTFRVEIMVPESGVDGGHYEESPENENEFEFENRDNGEGVIDGSQIEYEIYANALV